MFDEMLERLRVRARIFAVASVATLIITFAILFYAQRPVDDVGATALWSPFEVEVWFRRQNLVAATGIAHGTTDHITTATDTNDDGSSGGYINGEQLTMLSLNDLRRLYLADGKEDIAVDVYRALQSSLRPLAPITTWFIVTVIIQTGFIYGIMFFILLCVGVRYVKKKVDANPMVQQMKMLTGALAPPPGGSNGANGNGMMMNPFMNPFMMPPALTTTTTTTRRSTTIVDGDDDDDDDPTSAVDAPISPNALMDPTAMMNNPFLFPFGAMPPPGNGNANGAMNGMPLFPFGPMGMSMTPPAGLVARAAARRKAAADAQAAATNWTPDLD